jgi:hypothetical protein
VTTRRVQDGIEMCLFRVLKLRRQHPAQPTLLSLLSEFPTCCTACRRFAGLRSFLKPSLDEGLVQFARLAVLQPGFLFVQVLHPLSLVQLNAAIHQR